MENKDNNDDDQSTLFFTILMMEVVSLYAFKLQSNKVHTTLLVVLLHFEDIFFVGQCITRNNDLFFPFMSTFFGVLSLSDVF
jgi:hypothetical protein